MPELPEVETIRRGLKPYLTGRRASEIEITDSRLLSGAAAGLFKKMVLKRRWRAIERKGKYLIITLAGGWRIVFHLRMTGQLILTLPPLRGKVQDGGSRPRSSAPIPPPSPTGGEGINFKYRMKIVFDNGYQLFFCDQRRFGEVSLHAPGSEHQSVARLGPDPLNQLTCEQFVKILEHKTARIKPLIMDQHIISGVGNIYAQEALFASGINPGRRAGRLSAGEAEKLYVSLRQILITAIRHRGSTSRDYRDALGRHGRAQTLHKVYRRGGKSCLRCGTALIEKRIGGRGTVYCRRCQK
jgi:formamidopyrimidine-DNA glycosylase